MSIARAEQGATLIGLIGIADPPRTEAIEAVAAARAAGITTVMITGDHLLTAQAIARELGIVSGRNVEDDVVDARATPEDKIRIVREWKARGAVLAMTGDGVNDAPALREAHIGIAMGRTGLVYLLSGNAAELTVMLVAALGGLPLPRQTPPGSGGERGRRSVCAAGGRHPRRTIRALDARGWPSGQRGRRRRERDGAFSDGARSLRAGRLDARAGHQSATVLLAPR